MSLKDKPLVLALTLVLGVGALVLVVVLRGGGEDLPEHGTRHWHHLALGVPAIVDQCGRPARGRCRGVLGRGEQMQ